jgi:transposase InsO family protein
MTRRRKKPSKNGRRAARNVPPFAHEFRLKVARLYVEDGYPAKLIASQFGISDYSVYTWGKKYREHGEQGLVDKPKPATGSKLPEAVSQSIVDLKKANPGYGARRISDILKRFFWLRTSPSTVQRTLRDQGLTQTPKPKREKNPAKPRFFERARPNQMWQSDIMTFRLAGKNAYLIGFIDDYSRYVTGLGFYRSQTAENVIETYRRAVGEYGVPKEMLTDNGRQYTNWRGTTRFEKELSKDRVKHIRSAPHHPMTLGKIERFWQSILSEFLQRAQFTSYEDAAARISFWTKFYNYKRPHQGIGGLCPADRFFEIDTALKKTLEQGVEENALELALRGEPRDPFYMVGRMGDQSVVIRAEKGRVKMLVDDNQELVYDAERGRCDENQTNPPGVRPETEDHRRIVHLDGAKEYQSNLPGDVGQLDADRPVAEPGHGGDDRRLVAEKEGRSQAVEPAAATADRQEHRRRQAGQIGKTTETDPEQSQLMTTGADDGSQESQNGADQGHGAGPADHEGALRSDDGRSGSRPAGRIAQDLL